MILKKVLKKYYPVGLCHYFNDQTSLQRAILRLEHIKIATAVVLKTFHF